MNNISVAFTCDNKLKEVYHMWTTNKNENLNQSIMKYAPKHTYLCTTKSAESIIHTAVGIDNVGVNGFYTLLYHIMGMKYKDTIIEKQHLAMDKRKRYHNKYKQSLKEKAKKSKQKSK